MARKNRKKLRYVLEEEAACGGPLSEATIPVNFDMPRHR
jgi:hypothetical protein